MKLSVRWLGLTAVLVSCAQEPALVLPEDLLAKGDAFVEVQRPRNPEGIAFLQTASAPVGFQDGDHTFFVAIRRDLLAERWFLSAFVKQFFPGDVSALADFSLGTRVVSFAEQNDK